MARLLSWELFPAAKGTGGIDISNLSRHVINAEKANVHHAIIITGIRPGNMSEKEMQVYRLVAGRMLEAFMAPCRIETTNIEAVCAAQHFKAEQTRIIEAGWHDVFMRSDMIHLNAETFFKKPETFFRKRRNIFLKARGLFRRPQKASAGWSGNVRSLRPNRPHDKPQ